MTIMQTTKLTLCPPWVYVGSEVELLILVTLGTRWRWLVSFVPQSHRGGGGEKSRSRRFGGEENLLPLPGIEPRYLGYPVCSKIALPTTIVRVSVNCKHPGCIARGAQVVRRPCAVRGQEDSCPYFGQFCTRFAIIVCTVHCFVLVRLNTLYILNDFCNARWI
jgi:hypothetical protein